MTRARGRLAGARQPPDQSSPTPTPRTTSPHTLRKRRCAAAQVGHHVRPRASHPSSAPGSHATHHQRSGRRRATSATSAQERALPPSHVSREGRVHGMTSGVDPRRLSLSVPNTPEEEAPRCATPGWVPRRWRYSAFGFPRWFLPPPPCGTPSSAAAGTAPHCGPVSRTRYGSTTPSCRPSSAYYCRRVCATARTPQRRSADPFRGSTRGAGWWFGCVCFVQDGL